MAALKSMKQEGFVQDLRKGDSQRIAYRNNYNCENMTDKTVDEAACRLLANSKVNARYLELMNELRDKVEEKGLVDALDVLQDIIDTRAKVASIMACIDDKDQEGLGFKDIATLANARAKQNELLGKTMSMFTDKVEHSGEISAIINIIPASKK